MILLGDIFQEVLGLLVSSGHYHVYDPGTCVPADSSAAAHPLGRGLPDPRVIRYDSVIAGPAPGGSAGFSASRAFLRN